MPRPRIPNRRERVLDAAEALILEHGFDAMSVSAVAERAGIGKGALYLDFSGKPELRDALLRRANARLDARIRADVGANARLSDLYRASARALLEDPLLTAAFLDDRGVLGRHVDEVADTRYRHRQEGVIGGIRDLQERGMLAADIDPEDLALALSSATIGLLSAARLLGPLTPLRLEGAVEALARMAATFEPATDPR